MLSYGMPHFSLGTSLIQLAIVACIVVYASFFLRGMSRGTVRPVLATWLFLSLATILSFITNFAESGARGLLANSFNMIDTLAVWIISLVVIFHKDTRTQFTRFEKWCLGVVVVIFIGWLISGQNVMAHLSIQAILVIAYLPTLHKLWLATKNTESLGGWSFDCLASVFGIVEPLQTVAVLPLVYVIRSIVSTLSVIFLILRIKFLKRTS